VLLWYGPAPMRGQVPRVLRLRLAGCVLVLAAVVLAPTAAGDPSDALRSRDDALAAKSRAAVLSLYAIESELTRARGQLASIQTQAQDVRRERALVALRMQIARRGVRISQDRLATRLRALYEQREVDPIAIVLGADSLDAALTGLDSLGQMASGDHAVIEQVRGARHSLDGLQLRLAERQRRLDRLVSAAAATAQSLEATVTSRSAYVDRLSSQRRMTEAAIAMVEQQASAARARAQTLELASPSMPVADPGSAAPAVTTAEAPLEPAIATPAGAQTITVTATGYALPGTTATGLPVGWGVVAVDPSVIPLSSHFAIPCYGEGVAADVGGAVRGSTIDLWFPTDAQAHAWGRRTVTIVLR
jgi:peptidoglycan DL-endopeptidase CwlO